MDTNAFFEHHGVPGMKWGVTKAEYKALGSKDKQLYRKKNFTERGETYKKASKANTLETIAVAKKYKDKVFIKTASPGKYPVIMTGEEFTKNIINSRKLFNSNATSIYGFVKTSEGKAAQKQVQRSLNKIWKPTSERYVLKK